MRYREAMKLHNGDEVMLKGSSWYTCIVKEIRIDKKNKDVFLLCSDGNILHHTEIK